MIPKVIDELNERMERTQDNEELEQYQALESFYEWFVENFVY